MPDVRFDRCYRYEDLTRILWGYAWVVCPPRGGTVKLTARHERAGTVTTQVELPGGVERG